MTLVTFLFFAHQPSPIRLYEQRPPKNKLSADQFADYYIDEEASRSSFCHAADNCYYPATQTLLGLLREKDDAEKPFKVAYGLSGTFLAQAQRYEPGLIALLQELGATGRVEFIGQPYYHSLASLYEGDRREFKEQVRLQSDTIEKLFGQRPTVFCNTECLYNNTVAEVALHMGFDGIITEGVDWLMEGWRSPDYIYEATCGLPVLLRNYQLSEEISLHFADRKWQHWPLNAETFAGWLGRNTAMHVLLAMNYETLGVGISADAGIFEFFKALPGAIRQHPQLDFSIPSESIGRLPRQGKILVNDFATISAASQARDTTPWLGNPMQQFSFEELKRMELDVRATHDPALLHAWRQLQSSDHLLALSDSAYAAGGVREHFRVYSRIFAAFTSLQTALTDLLHRADSDLTRLSSSRQL